MEYKGLERKGKGSIRVGNDYGAGEQRKSSVRANTVTKSILLFLLGLCNSHCTLASNMTIS